MKGRSYCEDLVQHIGTEGRFQPDSCPSRQTEAGATVEVLFARSGALNSGGRERCKALVLVSELSERKSAMKTFKVIQNPLGFHTVPSMEATFYLELKIAPTEFFCERIDHKRQENTFIHLSSTGTCGLI